MAGAPEALLGSAGLGSAGAHWDKAVWGPQRQWMATLARALVGRAGNYKETLQRKFLLWLFPLLTLGSSVIFELTLPR